MKNQIRNICITDVKTVEEYRKVCELCGDDFPINNGTISEIKKSISEGLYLFDMNSGRDTDFMYFWLSQEKDPNFENCEQMTYAEFINKYDIKETICADTAHWFRASDYCKSNGLSPMESEDWNLALEKTKLPELEVDAKVLVWVNGYEDDKKKRYFSHFNENGRICTFLNGTTSWSNEEKNDKLTMGWDNWELVND